MDDTRAIRLKCRHTAEDNLHLEKLSGTRSFAFTCTHERQPRTIILNQDDLAELALFIGKLYFEEASNGA